jgi:hypothetical protein
LKLKGRSDTNLIKQWNMGKKKEIEKNAFKK